MTGGAGGGGGGGVGVMGFGSSTISFSGRTMGIGIVIDLFIESDL